MYQGRRSVSEAIESSEAFDQGRVTHGTGHTHLALRPVKSAPDLDAKKKQERPSPPETPRTPVEIEERYRSDDTAHRQRPRLSIPKIAFGVGLLAALGVGAWFSDYWWTTGRFIIATDDAYVGAHAATLEAKVSGYLSAIAVDDNARVVAGDVIARIDDGDYQLAVQTAQDFFKFPLSLAIYP